jgi:hypothetical protein
MEKSIEAQIRRSNGETIMYPSIHSAFEAAVKDKRIWKISFEVDDHMHRFVRQYPNLTSWVNQPLIFSEDLQIVGENPAPFPQFIRDILSDLPFTFRP